MPKLLSQAQFARKMKYSRARICQLAKVGIIQLKNGRIDPVQANAAIEANIDRTRRTRSESAKARTKKGLGKTQIKESPQMSLIPGVFNTGPQKGSETRGFNTDVSSLTETRQQHEAVKMELSKLKLEMEKGNLIPRDRSTEWLSLIVANAKLQLLGIPKRMAVELAVLTDPKEIEHRLRSEIRRILEEMGSPAKDRNHETKKSVSHASTTTAP